MPLVHAGAGDRLCGEKLRGRRRWWAVTTMRRESMLLAMLVPLPAPLAFGIAAGMAALLGLGLVGYGGVRVSLVDGVFSAGRARIPVTFLREPEPLDGPETRRAAGVEADARAYLLLRPYVATSVRVRLTDPADPAPYWLVSTRHPTLLVDELSAAIAAAG